MQQEILLTKMENILVNIKCILWLILRFIKAINSLFIDHQDNSKFQSDVKILGVIVVNWQHIIIQMTK